MAGEIEIKRFVIVFIADKSFEHADDFCAFLIDGSCVEVVDLNEALGAHRVGQRAAIFAELAAAQIDHI